MKHRTALIIALAFSGLAGQSGCAHNHDYIVRDPRDPMFGVDEREIQGCGHARLSIVARVAGGLSQPEPASVRLWEPGARGPRIQIPLAVAEDGSLHTVLDASFSARVGDRTIYAPDRVEFTAPGCRTITVAVSDPMPDLTLAFECSAESELSNTAFQLASGPRDEPQRWYAGPAGR